MSEFTVRVEVQDGVGMLRWERQQVSVDVLEKAISLAADDALVGRNLRRLQVELPVTDRHAIRAVQRAGFRREGILREAAAIDGELIDVAIYARIASDIVYGPHAFSGVMETVLPKKRVIAHVILTNDDGKVLLAETTYKHDWELPGGVVEPGESPRQGAQREVLEELGISVTLQDPVIIDWMPAALNWSDALEFIYLAGQLGPATEADFVLAEGEIKAVHWVAPSELEDRVSDVCARRIRLALDGFTGVTEDGHPRG